MSDLGVRVGADTSGAIASFNALGSAGERELEKIQRALRFATQRMTEMQREQKMATQTIVSSGAATGQAAAAMRMLPAQMTDVATQLAGGQSPFLILLQQGGQIKDSFGGFGPMFRGLAGAITPVGVAIGAVAAVTGTAALAYFEGRKQSDEFAKAVLLTGNAAGMTEGKFNGLITVINATTGASLSASRAAAQAVAGAGVFGPQSFNEVTSAVANFSRVTGQTADDTVKHFARMADGVAKWAAEENRQRHFLTAQQYARIKALEEEGKTQEAMAVTADALSEKLKHQADNLGWIEKALKTGKEKWDSWWNAAMGLGRAETVEDKLDAVSKKLRQTAGDREAARSFVMPHGGYKDSDSALRDEQASLQELQRMQRRGAAVQAEIAQTNQASIAAQQYFDKLQSGQKTLENRNKALAEYDRNLKALRDSGMDLPSEKQQKFDRQQIIDKYSERTSSQRAAEALKLQSAYDQRMASLTKEAIKLEMQSGYWEKYGRAVDNTRVALLKVDLATGDLGKLTPAQKQALLNKAAEADAKAVILQAKESEAAVQKQVVGLLHLASAREESAREAFIARELEKKGLDGLKGDADAYAAAQAKIRQAAGAAYDATRFTPAMAEWIRTGDERVKQLELESKMLVYTVAEREKANEMLRIEADYRRRLALDPEQASALASERDRQMRLVGQSLDDRRKASRMASTGADQALGAWLDSATNQAQAVSNLITGSLDRAADALTRFATTGKLSFSDLASFMAQEWLRMQIKMQMAEWLKPGSSGGSSILSGLGSLWGAISGAPPAASGINYVPYDGFPAILHEGERVQTKYEASKGSGAGSVDASVRIGSIGSGVSRGEMHAAIAMAQASAERRRLRLQAQGVAA